MSDHSPAYPYATNAYAIEGHVFTKTEYDDQHDYAYDQTHIASAYPYQQQIAVPTMTHAEAAAIHAANLPAHLRPSHIPPPHPQPIPDDMPRPTMSPEARTAASLSPESYSSSTSPWEVDEEGELIEPTPNPAQEASADPQFPTPFMFEVIVYDYLKNLSPKKRDKALLNQNMYDSVMVVLQDPKSTDTKTAQFRFWAKKMFSLTTFEDATVICHDNKPVAVKEQIFEVLVHCHRASGHGGRDKTSAQVRRYYSWIPKEIIARFVRDCPFCQSRRTQSSASIGNMSGPQAFLYSLHADESNVANGKRKVSLATAKAQAIAQGHKPYAKPSTKEHNPSQGKIHTVGGSSRRHSQPMVASHEGVDGAYGNMLGLEGIQAAQAAQNSMPYQHIDFAQVQFDFHNQQPHGAYPTSVPMGYDSSDSTSRSLPLLMPEHAHAQHAHGYSMDYESYYPPGLAHRAPPPLLSRASYSSTDSAGQVDDYPADQAYHHDPSLAYESQGSSSSRNSSHSSLVPSLVPNSYDPASHYDPGMYPGEYMDNVEYLSPKSMHPYMQFGDEKPTASQLQAINERADGMLPHAMEAFFIDSHGHESE